MRSVWCKTSRNYVQTYGAKIQKFERTTFLNYKYAKLKWYKLQEHHKFKQKNVNVFNILDTR